MKIIISTGSSGGHVFPALAVADELKKSNEILFICDKGKREEVIREKGYCCFAVSLTRFKGLSSLPAFLSSLRRAYQDCLKTLDDFSPQALAGFGSYASVSAVLAARRREIPVIIHEQNVLPGRANRFLARFADKVAVSFPEGGKYFPKNKVVYTGCPVRPELISVDKIVARQHFGLSDRFTILVLGGSKGSHNLNDKFVAAIRNFPQRNRLQVIHLCGEADYQLVREAYQEIGITHCVFAFFKEMGYAYKLADLVISRAGASAISEIALFGLPAILVPYPFARGHQRCNAGVLTKAGGAILIEDEDLSWQALGENILKLINDPQRLKEMGQKSLSCAAPEAVKKLAAQIIELAGEDA